MIYLYILIIVIPLFTLFIVFMILTDRWEISVGCDLHCNDCDLLPPMLKRQVD